MKKKIIIAITAAIGLGASVMSLLTGCSGKGNDNTMDSVNCHGFSKTSQAEWQILPADKEIPRPCDFYVTDTTFIVLGLQDDLWLHEYDLTTGKHIASHIPQGQGPEEVVNAVSVSSANDSTIEFFDIAVFKARKFSKSPYESIATMSVRPLFRSAINAWDLGDNRQLVFAPYVSEDEIEKRSYAITNEAIDTAYYVYNQLPEIFSERPKVLFMMCAQTVSPDKNHFASMTSTGGAIEFFAIEGDSIVETFSAYPYPLKFKDDMFDGEPVVGFTAACSSNDDVYASFAGTTNAADATKIGVWSWDGTPVEQIDTDCQIVRLARQQSSGKMFGIVKTEGGLRLASLDHPGGNS